MILGINHVQVSIPENAENAENEARKFYCDFLGLSEIEKPEVLKVNGGLWLQVGALQVHLGCEDNINRASTKSHIAYEIENEEVLRELLIERNVPILESVQIRGYKRFDIRDPFGNKIEFMQRI